MASGHSGHVRTAAERVQRLVAVQTLLHLNWFHRDHVLRTAQRMLDDNRDPHTTPPLSDNIPPKSPSSPEPFSALALMQELESSRQARMDEDSHCELEDPRKRTVCVEGNDVEDMRRVRNKTDDFRRETCENGGFLNKGGACDSSHGFDSENSSKSHRKKYAEGFGATSKFREKDMSVSASAADTEGSFLRQKAEEARTVACGEDTPCSSMASGPGEARELTAVQKGHAGDSGKLHHPANRVEDSVHTDCPGMAAISTQPTSPASAKFQKIGNSHQQHQLKSAAECLEEEKPLTTEQTIAELRRENARLKALRVCRQCRVRPVNLTLLPCGHLCLCDQCGEAFSECPVCLKTVLADVKTYVV